MTDETVIVDFCQYVRFTAIDEQIARHGVKVLSGLSEDELLADLLGDAEDVNPPKLD